MENRSYRRPSSGFSLLEVFLVVAALGVVATIAIGYVGGFKSSVDREKLNQDVKTLNSAVSVYQSMGGSLEGLDDPQDVLEKLKTTVTADLVSRMPGLSGSVVDSRLEAVISNDAPDEVFAEWNPATGRFELVTEGNGTQSLKIVKFALGEASTEVATEEREMAMSYAAESTWVWDYQDKAAPTPIGTTVVTTTPVPGGPPPLPTKPPAPAVNALDPPIFSLPPGSYPLADFDLSVSIANPNPPGSSTLFYSINFGTWTFYPGGGLTIPPGTVLKAQAIASTPAFENSIVTEGTYSVAPGALLPPGITLSDPAFDPGVVDTVVVTIANPNDPSVSRIDYRLDGGSWQAYTGPFPVTAADWPDGVTIESYAVATAAGWSDSDMAAAVVSEASEFFDVTLEGNVLLVLDASGSMNSRFANTNRFQRVVEEAVDAINALAVTQNFSVITFNSGLHWSDGSGDLKPATPENKEAAIDGLRSLTANGGTNYEVGLSYAASLTTQPDQVVFLSDGLPNQRNYTDEIDTLVSLGIQVDTIGIGNFNSQGSLQELASLAGGSHRFVAEPGASGTLKEPEFSENGGDFDADEFPIALTLENPNSEPSSYILYSLNDGDLETYSGPIMVEYDTTVTAHTASADPSWLSSSEVSESYLVKGFDASRPEIQLSSDKFEDDSTTITVTLNDRNPSGLTSLVWWFDNQDESQAVAYTGPFTLSAADWETFAGESVKEIEIVTRAVSTKSFVSASDTEDKRIRNETTAFLDNLDKDPLDRPTFAPRGDRFEHTEFPIEVSLTNPNGAEGQLQVSIDGGAYAPYSGPISAGHDTQITAYVKKTNGTFRDSEPTSEEYTVDSVDLKRPEISMSSDTFNPTVQTITVTLTNPNPADLSQLIYWFDGQDEETDAIVYSGPIVLDSNSWESYIKEGKGEAKLFVRSVGTESFVFESNIEDVKIRNKN